MVRWPHYATAPQAQEHVTAEGSKASSFAKKLTKPASTPRCSTRSRESTPGSSALVLLSADAAIDTVAQAFEGHAMELMRSDLSVQQEDRLREAFAWLISPEKCLATDPVPPERP